MINKNVRTGDATELRKRAEEIAREKAALSLGNLKTLSLEEIQQILHELQVHQIELEMQNEELRMAQAELDAARARYFDIYELAPVGYFILSEKGLILEANLTAATLLGVARGTLVKQPISRFIHKEDQDIYYLHCKKLFETGETQAFDLRMMKNDGVILWANLSTTAVRDTISAPMCRVVISDITNRKQMDRNLLESEKLLSSIFRAAPTGIGVVRNRILLTVNDRVCDITGYSREEMIGQSARMLYPNDAQFEHVGTEKYRQILESGTGTVETLWQCKDGRIIDILMSSTPINPMDLAAGVTFTALDITESKKAEDALRESEERFRKLFQKHSAVKLIIDPDTGRIIDANDAASRFYGWPIDEIRQMHIQQINTLPHEAVKTNMEKTQSSESARYEFRHRRADGSIKDVEVFSNKIDMAGKSFLYSIVHDISERKQAEEALLQEYAFRNAIIDHVAEGLCVCHETKAYPFVKFTIWNERMAEITGYTLEEINRLGWYQTVYPDPELRAKAIERMQKMRQSDDLRAEEWEITRADGNKRVLIISSSVFKSDDGVTHVMALMQDITERKRIQDALLESETRYRLLADNAMDVIWTVDFDNRMTYVSPSIERLFGFTAEEAMARTMQQAFTPTSFEIAIQIFAEEMAIESAGHGDPSRSRMVELEMFHKKGNTIPIEGHFSFLRDPTRRAIGILSIVREITERKRFEAENAELEAQNWQLQKAESLGCMAGAIAHHFNNQLQVVMGNMEMAMVSPPLGADASALLEEALKAAHKAAQISGQMLTYRGQAPGKHALLDLSEICLQTLPILQAAAPKYVILKADFSSPGPVIRANAGQIQQVLTNLVSNAFEAVGKNQGIIALTVKTVSRADIPLSKHFPIEWQPEDIVYGCLEVADPGCGITENDIDKIFDPFFTTKFTGRGLGLPVVLGIVRTQHGAITVESKPGWGSIFRVIFPVSTEEAPHKPDKLSQPPETEGGAIVLVVDDDEMVRNMAATMLRHLGFSVIEAKDGIEAVEIFRQHKDEIRCVLSDLTMPHMDGWETLAAMRELSPGIPVILSSGYDEAQVMSGEHTEQPNAFLGKPYQLKGLRETISCVLTDQ